MKSEIGAVAGPNLIATHPDLHHYTTFSALSGIVESNSLWATHFLDLNDSREVFLLEEPLMATLNEVFGQILQQRHSAHINREVSRIGGLIKAAARASGEFVQIL